jgi:hypothetical protein
VHTWVTENLELFEVYLVGILQSGTVSDERPGMPSEEIGGPGQGHTLENMPTGVRKKSSEGVVSMGTSTKGSSRVSLKSAPAPPPTSGVLCPGVRLVAGYEASEKGRGKDKGVGSGAASKGGATKRKRGDSDDESCGGYGPEIQTLAKDIVHLQKLFPGEFPGGRLAPRPPSPPPPTPCGLPPSVQATRALLSVWLVHWA